MELRKKLTYDHSESLIIEQEYGFPKSAYHPVIFHEAFIRDKKPTKPRLYDFAKYFFPSFPTPFISPPSFSLSFVFLLLLLLFLLSFSFSLSFCFCFSFFYSSPSSFFLLPPPPSLLTFAPLEHICLF